MEGIKSPLKLANYRPEQEQIFRIYTYNEIIIKNEFPKDIDIPEIFKTRDEIRPYETKVKVLGKKQGNFFACESEGFLKVGNSGSPLFDDNDNVVGILHGGNPDTNMVIFQYADIITRLIEDSSK